MVLACTVVVRWQHPARTLFRGISRTLVHLVRAGSRHGRTRAGAGARHGSADAVAASQSYSAHHRSSDDGVRGVDSPGLRAIGCCLVGIGRTAVGSCAGAGVHVLLEMSPRWHAADGPVCSGIRGTRWRIHFVRGVVWRILHRDGLRPITRVSNRGRRRTSLHCNKS
jgi:hypothetical protein